MIPGPLSIRLHRPQRSMTRKAPVRIRHAHRVGEKFERPIREVCRRRHPRGDISRHLEDTATGRWSLGMVKESDEESAVVEKSEVD